MFSREKNIVTWIKTLIKEGKRLKIVYPEDMEIIASQEEAMHNLAVDDCSPTCVLEHIASP